MDFSWLVTRSSNDEHHDRESDCVVVFEIGEASYGDYAEESDRESGKFVHSSFPLQSDDANDDLDNGVRVSQIHGFQTRREHCIYGRELC